MFSFMKLLWVVVIWFILGFVGSCPFQIVGLGLHMCFLVVCVSIRCTLWVYLLWRWFEAIMLGFVVKCEVVMFSEVLFFTKVVGGGSIVVCVMEDFISYLCGHGGSCLSCAMKKGEVSNRKVLCLWDWGVHVL